MTLSIRLQALMWALGAFALGAALLVAGSWWLLEKEMSEVFEDNLKQVALAVATHHRSNGTNAGQAPPRLAQQLPRIYEEYGKFEFVTQVWSRDGRRLHTSDASVNLPFLSRSGISTVTAGGEQWHLYTIVQEDAIVQAGQRASERESLSRETASGLIAPALLMLVVAAGFLAYALRRGLAPLSHAASEVTARNVEALHPIALDTQPVELRPLVAAINDLMARLGSALALQRNFAADAAHELRSPIAALRLQLPLLERAEDESQRRAALAELGAGIARAQHLVEQLLELSRVGPDAPVVQRQQVDLGQVARSVVGAFSARAEQQHVDLGAVVTGPVEVAGDVGQLTILANNLVDNALRHTPRGGRIDVAVQEAEGAPVLAVIDSGPGIEPAERGRVFDRFYRGAEAGDGGGSGLGLAIVKAIALRHNARVALDDAPGGGLRVTVSFPPLSP
jgi:signal transduction histidine kinase